MSFFVTDFAGREEAGTRFSTSSSDRGKSQTDFSCFLGSLFLAGARTSLPDPDPDFATSVFFGGRVGNVLVRSSLSDGTSKIEVLSFFIGAGAGFALVALDVLTTGLLLPALEVLPTGFVDR